MGWKQNLFVVVVVVLVVLFVIVVVVVGGGGGGGGEASPPMDRTLVPCGESVGIELVTTRRESSDLSPSIVRPLTTDIATT